VRRDEYISFLFSSNENDFVKINVEKTFEKTPRNESSFDFAFLPLNCLLCYFYFVNIIIEFFEISPSSQKIVVFEFEKTETISGRRGFSFAFQSDPFKFQLVVYKHQTIIVTKFIFIFLSSKDDNI